MRPLLITCLLAAACGGGENAGAEQARKEAEEAAKAQPAVAPAKRISPPVPAGKKIPCSQLVDGDKYTQALGETAPLTITDSKSEPEAAASCSLVRGGKKVSDAEQKALIKKNGKLGVLPGDEVCNISAFCSTIEDPAKFMTKCLAKKDHDEDMGNFHACVRIVATGEWDVKNFSFYDDDTKCILQVRAGPSNVDNDLIAKCAKTAHDLIGPDQIKLSSSTP